VGPAPQPDREIGADPCSSMSGIAISCLGFFLRPLRLCGMILLLDPPVSSLPEAHGNSAGQQEIPFFAVTVAIVMATRETSCLPGP
jgi:hypothetical protein